MKKLCHKHINQEKERERDHTAFLKEKPLLEVKRRFCAEEEKVEQSSLYSHVI